MEILIKVRSTKGEISMVMEYIILKDKIISTGGNLKKVDFMVRANYMILEQMEDLHS